MDGEGGTVQKNLERAVSQKALQMSNSASCKAAVVGFLAGVCITYLFLAAVTSVGIQKLGAGELKIPMGETEGRFRNQTMLPVHTDREFESVKTVKEMKNDRRIAFLYSAWEELLNSIGQKQVKSREPRFNMIPKAPHLEDCKARTKLFRQLDMKGPPWPRWQGRLITGLSDETLSPTVAENVGSVPLIMTEAANPPWVAGADEDNYPLTRKVQQDLWVHQHPQNCNGPQTRFLVADWEREPGFGIGAQIAGMTGFLAIAIKEKRVLVTNYFNRADHQGCLNGSSRSQWSCYFFPETSRQCRERALQLMKTEDAWKNGTVTTNGNYTSKEIWTGKIPRVWGSPWEDLQPTTEIDGRLLKNHRKMDRRWWRAQAVRYLMRFKSEYTCELLNVERHDAFGMQAAQMVVNVLPEHWPQAEYSGRATPTELEESVWSNRMPWVPRPLLSMHVRMGDKACEMKLASFDTYMQLADRIRKRFPNLKDVWLSTEMQAVIDNSTRYAGWRFYYTKNVARQVGNTSMADYEASLGRETSTNYPIVNFLMATEADFFVGALGSTWCYLIDGMRSTGGKVMAGYISVNKDRFW
ncbi:hypothetical protein EJ110_NYTH43884 [Nymphaea thermarum]|nr:hypothetical protein EJ110_NYTH43884 [Nymphaea thermarum]